MISTSLHVNANRIDSLRTNEDVTKFISQLLNEKYDMHSFVVKLKKPNKTSWCCDGYSSIPNFQIGSWKIIDFDRDGKNDLFVSAFVQNNSLSEDDSYESFIVIDSGNNKYNLQNAPDYIPFNCYAIKPIFIDNYPYLLYKNSTIVYKNNDIYYKSDTSAKLDYHELIKTDTLIYKYGGFIEVSMPNISLSVDSISYETGGCEGMCPVFKLDISKNGKAYYKAEYFNDLEGDFQTVIKEKELSEIYDLISYMNVTKLDSIYSVTYSDAVLSKLYIKFSDNSIKKINDNGQHGTFGLMRLYDLLARLRNNQNWK